MEKKRPSCVSSISFRVALLSPLHLHTTESPASLLSSSSNLQKNVFRQKISLIVIAGIPILVLLGFVFFSWQRDQAIFSCNYSRTCHRWNSEVLSLETEFIIQISVLAFCRGLQIRLRAQLKQRKPLQYCAEWVAMESAPLPKLVALFPRNKTIYSVHGMVCWAPLPTISYQVGVWLLKKENDSKPENRRRAFSQTSILTNHEGVLEWSSLPLTYTIT